MNNPIEPMDEATIFTPTSIPPNTAPVEAAPESLDETARLVRDLRLKLQRAEKGIAERDAQVERLRAQLIKQGATIRALTEAWPAQYQIHQQTTERTLNRIAAEGRTIEAWGFDQFGRLNTVVSKSTAPIAAKPRARHYETMKRPVAPAAPEAEAAGGVAAAVEKAAAVMSMFPSADNVFRALSVADVTRTCTPEAV